MEPILYLVLYTLVNLVNTQQTAIPCPFNGMCSCKMNRFLSDNFDDDYNQTQSLNAALSIQDDYDSRDVADEANPLDVKDVSCVGIPFATLPVLPRGKITHVDIVNSGLEVADIGPSTIKSTEQSKTKIESLRLMSNKIRHVGDQLFSSMSDDLKSLDLSYNELDEIPLRPLKSLRVLDWANFHSNRLASLDGLGQLWSHLSPTLRALFLGNNDITALQKSSTGVHGDGLEHHSLSWLRHLNWLNVDSNQLTEISAESLPARLHTLSAAHNRIDAFPVKAVDHLRDLRWLDLRGNYIRQLPSISLRSQSKLRLDKLDLGENLIWELPEEGFLFNKSLQVRDLHLDFNRLVRLPSAAFRGTNATRLYLASNKLSHIDDKAFYSLSSTLILLDLDRNQLKELPKALDHLKKLRFLYVAHNEISRLKDEALSSFAGHLEALSLAGNQLQQFPGSALKACTRLVHLNLAYNAIDNVSREMFQAWAQSLEVLILRGNQLAHLPERWLMYCKKLRELSLSFNRISLFHEDTLVDVADTLETLELNMALEKAHFPTALLKHLRHLQWLSLEFNSIETLPHSGLDHLNQLRYISLEGNRLHTIPGHFFKGNRLRQLRDIRLGYNAIDAIASKTFHNLQQVTMILLSSNKIHTVHRTAFDHLPKLITINLANNKISRIDLHAFRWLPNLLKIDLQSNRLREFRWDVFVNCTNPYMASSLNLSFNEISLLHGDIDSRNILYVKSIDLSHNKLTEFPTLSLSNLVPKILKKLLINDNHIHKLPHHMLESYGQELQVLELRQNNIEHIDKMALKGADLLQMIDLSHNAIESLPSGLFAHLSKLRIVNLRKNRLRQLPRDLLDNTALETLNLAHNHLNSLPVTTLSSVNQTLMSLDLSHNQLDHLDAVMFESIPNLVVLNLAHNRLTILPDNVFSHLNSLMTLDLSFNSIRANFKELFHYMQRVKELHLANINLKVWPHLPLAHLIVLNLSSNALEYRGADSIPNNIVIRLDRLRVLDLSRNRLTIAPFTLWSWTPLLKQLDLSYNPVRVLNRDSFQALSRLQILALQPLPVLETIEADSFHSLFYLNYLKLQTWSGPHLSQLLSGLHGLKRLNIDVRGPVLSNQLNNVATLEASPKLKEIDIYGLQLRVVQPDVFQHMALSTLPECTISFKYTSIRHLPERFINGLDGCVSLSLDLRSNNLQTFGPHSIRNNNSISVSSTRHLTGGLHLENNPWICSCENAWLGPWLKRWQVETATMWHPVSVWPQSGATCTEVSTGKRRHLLDLSPNESACSVAALSAGTGSIFHLSQFLTCLTVLAVVLSTIVLH